jgi:hypothetical protein
MGGIAEHIGLEHIGLAHIGLAHIGSWNASEAGTHRKLEHIGSWNASNAWNTVKVFVHDPFTCILITCTGPNLIFPKHILSTFRPIWHILSRQAPKEVFEEVLYYDS